MMHEFFAEALALVNLPFSILFVFVIVYWGFIILGAIDLDAFDVDFDLDSEGGGGRLGPVLAHFFHVDEGPFMAIASLLAVFLWMGAMILNHTFNPGHSWWLAGGLFIPNLVVSVLCTKAIVVPVFRLLRHLRRDEEPSKVPLLGAICRVTTSRVDAHSGQVEVERRGAPIMLNARTREGEPDLRKGDAAVIFSENKEENIYYIKGLEH